VGFDILVTWFRLVTSSKFLVEWWRVFAPRHLPSNAFILGSVRFHSFCHETIVNQEFRKEVGTTVETASYAQKVVRRMGMLLECTTRRRFQPVNSWLGSVQSGYLFPRWQRSERFIINVVNTGFSQDLYYGRLVFWFVQTRAFFSIFIVTQPVIVVSRLFIIILLLFFFFLVAVLFLFIALLLMGIVLFVAIDHPHHLGIIGVLLPHLDSMNNGWRVYLVFRRCNYDSVDGRNVG
jgi:hypothetical protein